MNIFDFVTKTFLPCSEEQIRAAETNLGFAFPEWYERFLQQSNGATFKYSFLGGMMLPFIGLASLERSIEMHEEFNFNEMELFPIGDCDGAAVVCLGLSDCQFYYYDIELSKKIYLGDTLDQFLELIDKETFSYYLDAKLSSGEITLEEYNRHLASRKS
jgi:SMI1 / KNR4 family (SUKH-1)